MMRPLCPVTSGPLTPTGPFLVSPEGLHYPVVSGIPYLRADRPDILNAANRSLDADNPREALSILLTDQDPFAPLPPPELAVTRRLANGDHGWTIAEIMRRLNYGPVADYFLHRTSTPTFLSGIALLNRVAVPNAPLVELACGVGQFLRAASYHHRDCHGLDLVFSKLWLAKTFVAREASYICADATLPPINSATPVTIFCHDAFYFFPDKERTIQHVRRLSKTFAVGHAHNKNIDSGIAGTPYTPHQYQSLTADATFYDNAELSREVLHESPATARTAEQLADAEAIAWTEGTPGPLGIDYLMPPAGRPLTPDPLLHAVGSRLDPQWPSERFAREYQRLPHLVGHAKPSPEVMKAAAAGDTADPAVRALVRARVLLDLPGGWL